VDDEPMEEAVGEEEELEDNGAAEDVPMGIEEETNEVWGAPLPARCSSPSWTHTLYTGVG
jgi:hypothetical protein